LSKETHSARFARSVRNKNPFLREELGLCVVIEII